MKKTIYSIIILALISLNFSCKQSPEKLAIGTWTLDSVSVINIDEVAKYYFEMDMETIDNEISAIDEQLQMMEKEKNPNVESYENLMSQKLSLEDQKAALNLETTKSERLEYYNSFKGLSYVFNEDKTYTNKSSEYVENGTWSISEDGKTITLVTADGYEYGMSVEELTSKNMNGKLYYPGEEGVYIDIDILYFFVK